MNPEPKTPNPELSPKASEPEPKAKAWQPDLSRVLLADLPPAFREVAGIIGIQAAQDLVTWRSGTIISVPSRLEANHPLAKNLGCQAADRLVKNYGRLRLYVPTLLKVCAPLRNRAIRSDYDKGSAIPDLTARYSLSERQVRQILNSPELTHD